MERDAVLGVLGCDIEKHGGEHGPRTFALAAGRADTGYYSVVVVLWSLSGQDCVQAYSVQDCRDGSELLIPVSFEPARSHQSGSVPRRGLIVFVSALHAADDPSRRAEARIALIFLFCRLPPTAILLA
jgi:hypothetical protein